MSHELISRSADLRQLQDEGYEVEVRSNHLLIHSVPYLNSRGVVGRGTLVSDLTLAGDVTTTPGNHVAWFVGEHPCQKDGREIPQIKHTSQSTQLAQDIVVNHSFSNKPAQGYANYHQKMTRYIDIVSAPAQSVDPTATARTFKPVAASPEQSVFEYLDTASSRAGILAVSDKLKTSRVAIVGLGGTGSYVLDLVAKTPVREIHLFDADAFLQHNAFRAPSAASLDDLTRRPSKVAYFRALYSRMRRGIVAHEEHVSEENVEVLLGFDFVFLCLDHGSAKKLIVDRLSTGAMSFIDVGIGVEMVPESLALWAICRVTTSTPDKREHFSQRVSFADNDSDNPYDKNIQVADLNALNAALAVIKWKKLYGFYQDLEKEHNTTYTTSSNLLTSDDLL
jgi:hypothetical protein